jgi:hypothetical protein
MLQTKSQSSLESIWHEQCNNADVMPSLVVAVVLSPLGPAYE